MLHIPSELLKSFRFILLISLALIAFFGYRYYQDTLPKEKLPHIEGRITYIDKKLGANPNRDFGMYRYLKLDSYNYPFEIYIDAPADQTRFDSLKTGDAVQVYGNGGLSDDSLNRFATRIEKQNKPYFVKSDFSKQLSIVMIGALVIFCQICFILYKKKKPNY